MPPNEITIRAPATSANLGPGFDVFGLALAEPSDKVIIKRTSASGIEVQICGFKTTTISDMLQRNAAGIVANHMTMAFSLQGGLRIRVEKSIWPGRGLGSSAAQAAAVAYGLNSVFNLKLTQNQLIAFAAKGEAVSAGVEHADNVAAAICGDFAIVTSYSPIEAISLKAPLNMEVAVAFPHIETPAGKTRKARSVLPEMVLLEQLVHNVGKAAAMVSGFAAGNVDLIGESMSDAVIEPARAFMIPGYAQVKENALNAGACGVTISGAGPAMLAVVNKKSADATRVAAAMKEGFKSAGCEATAFATRPGRGVCVLEK